jgi:5-methylcytosine-specific restriction endonuclease McrA
MSFSYWYNRVYLRSPHWRKIRWHHLCRAGHWCEECWYGPATVVHHLNYGRLFNEGPEDLLALCEDCHNRMHPIPKAANDNQLQLPLPLP